MTLHAAAARCQSGSLPMSPEKAKQLVLELEINLVHTAHAEKGEVLVTSKGPDDNFSEGGKMKQYLMFCSVETESCTYYVQDSSLFFPNANSISNV